MNLDILFLGIGIAAIVFARRWKNNDSDAGHGIAGWGIVIYIIYIISQFSNN